MKDRPMHDVGQGLPRRIRAAGSGRRYMLLNWKFLVPVAALLLAVAILPFSAPLEVPPATLTYTQLTRALDAGRVAALDIEPGFGVRGRWKSGAQTGDDFVVLYTATDISPLLARAEQAGATVAFRRAGETESYQEWIALGLQIGIVLALVVLLYYGLRQQMGGNRDVGASATGSDTSFEDVAGTQGAAEELREIVDFLRAPARFSALGARVPKGVLLVG
ncbi:MAG: hypothetical protein ACT443_05980, partial [Gemmatimonadota bacterium]